ncbi:MAG: tRNA (adenosine(37)-N6)-dimethylallyltransferase MiaA [Candidatus Sumerlaeota bacterium]|nr:tRNA (adenosine(37)-N6)-dimethylallyltransferase MiaA [Candidatus Sumerlaeota bacterium]
MYPESPLPAVAGPTGVGKTALAIALAVRRPIEVVSADSMQVYRGLDAGTSKPTAEERRAVPHHLIDVASPRERYDLARFLAEADRAIEDIRRRGRIPLVVGGTGLYLKGLAEGIFSTPSRDPKLRAALEERVRAAGAPALHAELARVDCEAARRISPNDAIRIVRALEVYGVTGVPISHWRQNRAAPQTTAHPLRLAVVSRRRETLNERIRRRVEAMLAGGWVDEVRGLLAEGLEPSAHCFKALGYARIARALRGEESFEGLAESIARETRRFAKRQMTWFRGMKQAVWLDVEGLNEAAAVDALEALLFAGA